MDYEEEGEDGEEGKGGEANFEVHGEKKSTAAYMSLNRTEKPST